MLPTFLVIGAAKSGTTSLHDYLGQHPDVFMSPIKEPNYFPFADGVPAYGGPDRRARRRGELVASARRHRLARHLNAVTDREAYERLFDAAGGAKAIGESSVLIMQMPECVDRIARLIPDAQLVVLLRQPADRAWSGWLHGRNQGLEPLADFGQALAAAEERQRRNWAPRWQYLRSGFYAEQLRPFVERFGRERLCVQFYDDFATDPAGVVRAIYRFLGVDDAFVPDTIRRLNAAAAVVETPRSRRVDELLNEPNRLKSAFNVLVPSRRLRAPLRAVALRLNRGPDVVRTKPEMPAAVRAELTALYRDDVLALEKLVGRDLSRWLT